ncbi:phosphotransferase family protein [Lutimaribacter marinistellae]|uniref:Phosphotransferase family protein n=1 Tax=Lutimaribacter marinistellae TaxID=1820329 RepID=A0ABV7TDT9_9RHOB
MRNHLVHIGAVPVAATFSKLAGGRTNRVWRVDTAGDPIVLKLYRSNRDNPLFRNDPEAEALCLAALSSSGLAPNLRAQGEIDGTRWVVYDFSAGTCWRTDPAPVARMLHRLHRRPALGIDLPRGPDGSADLTAQTRNLISLCRPDLQPDLMTLAPGGDVPAAGASAMIHGDPVPGNILCGAKGLCLIDWQCPVLGDPAEDLALFLSPAMQFIYRGAALSGAERTAFLGAYPDREVVERYHCLRPWFTWRMAAYCLWRCQQGAADYASAYELECAELRCRLSKIG